MSFNFELNDPFSNFAPATPPDGCTQCGICLGSCPTFAKSDDPEQSPMGRIRLMRILKNEDSDGITPEQMTKLESCLGCYSCETICPSKVDFGTMLDTSLATIRQHRPPPAITRIMLSLAKKPYLLNLLVKVSYFAQQIGLRALLEKLGIYKLTGLNRTNALLGHINYPDELWNHVRRSLFRKRVALFTGCFGSAMEKAVQQASMDVLNILGQEVVIPEHQGCCGALHRHNGDLETAEKLAMKNIKAFSTEQTNVIVTTSSGCGASLMEYGKWLEGKNFTIPVMDVSHYLANSLKQRKLTFNHLPLKVALHTPCSLRQHDDQEKAVTDLLQHVPGLEIIPLPTELRCCGAGGSQVLSQPAMADELRDDVINEINKMEVDVLVSSNLGCAMHLRAGLAKAGIDIPLKHPVQLLSQALS